MVAAVDAPVVLGHQAGEASAANVGFEAPGVRVWCGRLVLQGADGVVFVADSQRRQLEENVESLQDLHHNLAEQGVEARNVPLVLQYNKQDLPSELIHSASELSDALNFRGVPEFSADALHGPGVFETLRAISELVLKRLSAGAGAGTAAR